jgi:hypothetical protein
LKKTSVLVEKIQTEVLNYENLILSFPR